MSVSPPPTLAPCPGCGYDLATSDSKLLAVCPECGLSAMATTQAQPRRRLVRLGLVCAVASVPFIAFAELASHWGLTNLRVGREGASLEASEPLAAAAALAGASLILTSCGCLLVGLTIGGPLRRAGWWIVTLCALLALERFATANPAAGRGAWVLFGNVVVTWGLVGVKWLGAAGVAAGAWLLLRLMSEAARAAIMPGLSRCLAAAAWIASGLLAAFPVLEEVLESQKRQWFIDYANATPPQQRMEPEFAWRNTSLAMWHNFLGHWFAPGRAAILISVGVGALLVRAGLIARAEDLPSQRPLS